MSSLLTHSVAVTKESMKFKVETSKHAYLIVLKLVARVKRRCIIIVHSLVSFGLCELGGKYRNSHV